MVRQPLFLSLIVGLLCTGIGEARVPLLLNYQGHLQTATDSVQTDPILITFSIYQNETQNTPLWSELHDVRVQDGLFHVLLGSRVPFPDTLFAGSPRFLGIRIQGEQEFTPRQQIVSVAYALRAATAETVEGNITLQSLNLESGNASLDSLGILTAPQLNTDSLNVGGKGVIDRNGNWTGNPIVTQTPGMVLDTLIVKTLRDTLDFASTRFRKLDGTTDNLATFINPKNPVLLDIQLLLTVTATGDLFQTRLAVQPINPPGSARTDIGNLSSITPPSGSSTFLSANTAIVSLSPGLYRIFAEGKINGNSVINTGILTIRVFSR